MIDKQEIEILVDDMSGDYISICNFSRCVGCGTTREEALEDLRDAVYYYINSAIEKELKESSC